MRRLRTYLPLVAYLCSLPLVASVSDANGGHYGVLGALYGCAGIVWLLVFIWRNRGRNGPQADAASSSTWTYDARNPIYYETGAGNLRH